MTLPRRNIFQSADTYLTQVALQYHTEVLAELTEEDGAEVYALTESAIRECEELIAADKFYEC